ncbi:MAG: dihydropteroate synthase [Deltaproteobacteria bacterium CG_4_8_14_3_um_filter_51_11]|nr:dihydropteroate synthase [bacterium]OIP41185.1 MAG: dihydropteroate synthase [Desulfobacteraceae bacterium CG2_30_51_40]PIX19846.1 MAG: dihydropteroate synthase [Deltaproteobacteria bacterium CG_4_8_14_3_um_filter_51_11]PIY21578.1 MAG: dihydropteroate synthase [Deltaproteobacteria bacterium CG_4_10_14_3_um_filter_51_14]PJB34162.1 MAG: dihydropteroate synthase [Deltaproteobacteria bacterium CG_4_9_14_3_um_filter_51_14]
MLLIGENLNVINTVIGKAFKAKDPRPIAEEAIRQKEKGMDWIDINLGPARKGGPELMEFVVKTVQETIGDSIPLCLDTSNIEAMEAGLAAHKGKAIINSIMCRPERYEKMIPLAVKYKANMIALMWGPEGLPRDENERAALAVELIYAANEAGVPNEDIFVDGIVTPVNIQQPQAISLLAFQEMIAEIAPGAKSTCGLSNISNGVPDDLRPIINRTYMVMLEREGMYSAIADAYDDTLHAIARGKRPDIVEVIHKVMDEADIDMGSLSKELQGYVKTARVILGQTLFSDSWLEI